MDRRQFVKAGVAATLAYSVMGADQTEAQGTTRPMPNILYIFSDQHRAASLDMPLKADGTGNGTPFLSNTFRQNGCEMKACISNYPLCTPHRGILLSGQWPTQTGVYGNGVFASEDNNKKAPVPQLYPTKTAGANTNTLTETFAAANYNVGYVGKWDLNGDPGVAPSLGAPLQFGIESWNVWYKTMNHYSEDTGAAYFRNSSGDKQSVFSKTSVNSADPYIPGTGGAPNSYWTPRAQTRQAMQFLDETDSRPFFLVVSYNVPHPIMNPPQCHQNEGSKTLPLSTYPNYDAQSGTDFSGGFPVLESNVTANPPDADAGFTSQVTGESAKLDYLTYYQGITDIDAEVNMVVSHLTAAQLENTIIIYTSDHGDMLHSIGVNGKQFPYEESIRVPFFVMGNYLNASNVSTAIAPGSYSGVFSTIDIAPTLAGLAGLAKPSVWEGVNHASVILNASQRSTPLQSSVFIMNGPGVAYQGNGDTQNANYGASPVYRGVRTATQTYAVIVDGNSSSATDQTRNGHYTEFAGQPWILYNLFDDLGHAVLQTANTNQITANPGGNSAVIAAFNQQISNWIKTTGDAFQAAVLPNPTN